MKTANRFPQLAYIFAATLATISTLLGAVRVRTVTTPGAGQLPSSTPAAQSESMILSPSGDWGVFVSIGSGITDDLTDPGVVHIYRHDFLTHQNKLLTLSKESQEQANGSSSAFALSAEGRYALILSSADNLAPQMAFGRDNLMRLDLTTGEWMLVAADVQLPSANGGSDQPELSAHGQLVLFKSQNLALGNLPPNSPSPVLYLADLVLNKLTRENSYTQNGQPHFDPVADFTLAPDGEHAVYTTALGSLNGTQLIVRDLGNQLGDRVTQGNLGSLFAVSDHGRYFFYGTNVGTNMTVVRRDFGLTEIVSATAPANGNTLVPMISSPDGSRLFFATSKGLSYWDANTNNTPVQISPILSSPGTAATWLYNVSDDGTKVLFGSSVDASGSNTGPIHLYLADVSTGATIRITRDPSGYGEAYGNANMDGAAKRVAFDTVQPDYAAHDQNDSYDLIGFDTTTEEYTLLTHKLAGSPEPDHTGFNRMPSVALSENGEYAIFISSAPAMLGSFATKSSSLFRQNLISGEREILYVDKNGYPVKQNDVLEAMLSMNGNFALFTTYATNITPQDIPTFQPQLVLRDIAGKTNYLVNVDNQILANAIPRNQLLSFSISDDGHCVVYNTTLKNWPKIYNRLNNTATPLVVDTNGIEANSSGFSAVISPSGETAAFASTSVNLTDGLPPDPGAHIYLRTLPSGPNRWLSAATDNLLVLSSFTPAKVSLAYSPDSTLITATYDLTRSNLVNIVDVGTGTRVAQLKNAQSVVISDDRKYVAYVGFLDRQTYVTYLPSGETRLVTHRFNQPNTPIQGNSGSLSLDRDGVWLAFKCSGNDLVSEAMTDVSQVYLYNLRTDETIALSRSKNTNAPANLTTASIQISHKGSRAIFVSGATDLLSEGETSGLSDIFQTSAPADLLTERDSDADGLPDWWENRFFGTLSKQPSDRAPSGLSLQTEYGQTFNIPPRPKIEISVSPSSGIVQLRFTTIVGKYYQVETTLDPFNQAWPPIFSSIPGDFIASNTISTVSLPVAAVPLKGRSAVFFKIRQD